MVTAADRCQSSSSGSGNLNVRRPLPIRAAIAAAADATAAAAAAAIRGLFRWKMGNGGASSTNGLGARLRRGRLVCQSPQTRLRRRP